VVAMTPTEFHGYTRVMGVPENWRQNPQADCVPLFIRDDTIADCHSMESVWTLSDFEREEISRGANISLTILSNVHPPVCLHLTMARVLDDNPFGNFR